VGAPDGVPQANVSERGLDRVSVELVPAADLAEMTEEWHDLVQRADVPNVFMHPLLLRAAAGAKRVTAVLAWGAFGRERRLLGIWAFSAGRPRQSILPFPFLSAPAAEHGYLGSPAIDRDHLDETLAAMLDAIAAAPDLPNLIAVNAMRVEGATYDALLRVLTQRGSAPCQFESVQRPRLASERDAESYWQAALSSSSRKKLRQFRRRLGEKGTLQTRVLSEPAQVRGAFEQFLVLESQGWKGRRGTALASQPDDAAFARNMVGLLARTGEASMHVLELDGRPVSLQVVLHAGPAAYTWKTAYDEALGAFSPGTLLLEDYTKAFLGDPVIRFVDSCAHDDSGYMAAWQERQTMADFWFEARPGVSVQFTAAARLERAYRAARQRTKQIYLASPMLQRLQDTAATFRRMGGKREEKSAREQASVEAA
jgi:CelD/BcsL family acetyltransferase involved in cellulose biosynthesis